MAIANVKVEGLQKSFWDESRGEVRAVDGIDFDCQPGEVFGLQGLEDLLRRDGRSIVRQPRLLEITLALRRREVDGFHR